MPKQSGYASAPGDIKLSTLHLISYLAIGMIAGISAGLFGIGGGIIVVPGLVLVFTALQFGNEYLTHIAVGTSLATIIVTGSAAAWMHHQHGAVNWLLVKGLLPGVIVGAVMGAVLADNLSSDRLRQLFGLLQILLAIKLLFDLSPDRGGTSPRLGEMPVAGVIIGAIASCLGIGGGTLTGPYLVFRGQAVHHAVATASAVGVPIALTGAISFIVTGLDSAETLPAMSSGYIYWPAFAAISAATLVFAPIGARLAHRLNPAILQKTFALLLMMVGIKMLLT